MSPPPVSEFTPLNWGATAILVITFWKLIEVARVMFMNRQVPAATYSHQRHDDPPTDPLHERRMEEVHEKIMEGKGVCHWKDRDEVRDFIEAMRAQTAASKQLVSGLAALTEEMRRTRNGGSLK